MHDGLRCQSGQYGMAKSEGMAGKSVSDDCAEIPAKWVPHLLHGLSGLTVGVEGVAMGAQGVRPTNCNRIVEGDGGSI